MINGFVVEINKAINQMQLVALFLNQELPDGVTIRIPNADYDYKALSLLASTKGFRGSGINTEQELEITIHNGARTETHITMFLPEKEILIDGVSSYLVVNIPADSNVIFQLMPVL